MKKTLLATAIAGALGASAAAQAATVYDQDGTQLIINGRIAMGIAGGGPDYRDSTEAEQAAGAGEVTAIDNGAEFVNVYSRLGISMSHQVSSDLKAFGRVEWRFTGDERDTDSGFSEVRHSYIGLESASFGTVMAGNYDSFYNSHVAAPFDVYIDRGLELSAGNGGGYQARGDSVGYITPNLSGFQAFLSAKHYSERGETNAEIEENGDDEIVTQGGVKYETGPLRLALGYVDDEEDRAGGTGEVLYGATASYAVTDAFSARLGYETRDDNDNNVGGFDTWGLGATYAMGQWAFNADVYNISVDTENEDAGWADRTAWAAGAYYKVSSNFDVFLELYQGDQPDVDVSVFDPDVDVADGDDMYWLTGARYHF